MSSKERLPLSVVILTKNEEEYIGRCIRSVPFADEVVVVDSGSTDQTASVALRHGATVCEHEWPGNWAIQRNRGLDAAMHDWVLYLDADEIVTSELGHSIQDVLRSDPDPEDGYYLARPSDFMGRLMYDESRPSQLRGMVRLLNRRHNRFDESMEVHEKCYPVGEALRLDGVLLHWRGETLREEIESGLFYADFEARALMKSGKRAGALRLLVKPVLRFLWTYVKGQYFRLGMEGLIASLHKAFREFLTAARAWELKNVPEPVRHPPKHVYHDPPAGKLPVPHAKDGEDRPKQHQQQTSQMSDTCSAANR